MGLPLKKIKQKKNQLALPDIIKHWHFSVVCLKLLAYTVMCRCMIAFLDDYKTLVPKLLIETMATIGSNFVSRINLATGDVVAETKALAKGCI